LSIANDFHNIGVSSVMNIQVT